MVRSVTPPRAVTLREDEQIEDGLSPGGLWHQNYGDALSPGVRKRNIRLHERTPSKTHLGDESSAWLARHQEAVRNKLEKKCARAIKRGVSPVKADHAVPLVRLQTGGWGGALRQPSHDERVDWWAAGCLIYELLSGRQGTAQV